MILKGATSLWNYFGRSRHGSSDSTRKQQEENPEAKENFCNSSRARIFLVSVISFILATIVVLLVILTRLKREEPSIKSDSLHSRCTFCPQIEDTTKPVGCDDLAIVGAGLSGLYLAWSLRNANLSVTVYESSTRVGGALAQNIPAITYHANAHRRFNALLDELQVSRRPYLWKNASDDVMFYLRERHFAMLDPQAVPYYLRKDEKLAPVDLLRHLFSKAGVKKEYSNLSTSQRLRIAAFSLDSFLSKHSSKEARNFLKDTLRNDALINNKDNALASLFMTERLAEVGRLMTSQNASISANHDWMLVTDKTKLIQTLYKQFANSGQRKMVKPKQRVKKIQAVDEIIRLHFESPPPVHSTCAKRVVFAVPKVALSGIAFEGIGTYSALKRDLNQLEASYSTLISISGVLKATNASSPFHNFGVLRTDTALGDLHNLGLTDVGNGTTLRRMLSLSQAEHVDVWRHLWTDLQSKGNVQGQNQSIPETTSSFLFPLLENIIPGDVYDRERSSVTVFQSSADLTPELARLKWKVGAYWPTVLSHLRYQHARIHVIGAGFAHPDLQYTIEGALDSAYSVLAKFYQL